ncbi:MAG: histidine kinase [Halothiobacillaceae bacterium]|nr:MAG: histidine kinase [Halothiobacillaceae bacterium]
MNYLKPRLTKSRLRRLLGLIFLLLAVPMAILIYQAVSQMKWEAFRQQQLLAEELANRIDKRVNQFIQQEERRSFAEYSFLNVVGDVSTNTLQRSPLATFPVTGAIPGVIGYFQIDDQGEFSTPLLPHEGINSSHGIPAQEQQQRLAFQQQLQAMLSSNRLVKQVEPARALTQQINKSDKELADKPVVSGEVAAPASVMTEQDQSQAMAFDALQSNEATKQKGAGEQRRFDTLGRVEELQLKSPAHATAALAPQEKSAPSKLEQKRLLRKEQSSLPEPAVLPADAARFAAADPPVRITTFESEIDPFNFSQLNSGDFVLYRKVWRDGRRYTQGLLLEKAPFLHGVIEATFRETQLSFGSDLVVAYQGDVVALFSGTQHSVVYSRAAQLSGDLLYQTRLSTPLSELQLIFSITQLPTGPGAAVILWTALLLTLVLCGGFYLIYRVGVQQLALTQQQQDFVSAVSHELKTPLTSIRMYGEILREGWADETKKKIYYNYIHDESERLSRLINNVLQLARMTRNEMQFNLKPMTVGELIDVMHSKIVSQIEHTAFTLDLQCAVTNKAMPLQIDADAFCQIFINLVDNAIKFSAKATTKKIEIRCRPLGSDRIEFSVRDYGPGIAKDQLKKIFKLFYRAENELSRETVGTGIGLALVQQLALKMGGKIDVINREPGVEFKIIFKTPEQLNR